MSRLMIVIGDKTDHGGTVTSGAERVRAHGKAIACVDSDVHCPLHGPTKIITGHRHVLAQGRPVAVEGDLTSCGARLISVQQSTCWVGTGPVAANGSRSSPASVFAAQPSSFRSDPPPPLLADVLCDERFQLLDHRHLPFSRLKYALLQDGQCIAFGALDERGQSQPHGGPTPADLLIAIAAPSPALE